MNYKKVNQLALKNHYAKDSDKTIYGMYKEKVGVCDHSNRVLLVPADKFILDVDKLRGKRELFNIEKAIGSESDYEDAYLTNELKIIDNRTLVKIHGEKADGWIAQNYIAEFEKDAEYRVSYFTTPKGVTKVKAILVLEYDDIVGMILPVNINI